MAAHVVYVLLPLFFILPFMNLFNIIKYYLQGYDEILFNLRKKKVLKFFLWTILGPFILFFLAIIDNYNVF